MTVTSLPIPHEPRSLKIVMRTLLEQAAAEGLPLVLEGSWIADPLWNEWGETLQRRGLDRARFGQIVAGYANEFRLWVVGERPWEQAAGGFRGRLLRRLPPMPEVSRSERPGWQEALGRVGIHPEAEMAALVARIHELQLLYEMASPPGPRVPASLPARPAAVVWAGARPRDPEAPYGESGEGTAGAAALAEALGRFLLKDPAYPPV